VFHQDFLLLFFQDHGVQSLLDFWALQRVFRIPRLTGLRNCVEDVQSTLKHYFREDLKHFLESQERWNFSVVRRWLTFTGCG
jgi:hypothetical protein